MLPESGLLDPDSGSIVLAGKLAYLQLVCNGHRIWPPLMLSLSDHAGLLEDVRVLTPAHAEPVEV